MQGCYFNFGTKRFISLWDQHTQYTSSGFHYLEWQPHFQMWKNPKNKNNNNKKWNTKNSSKNTWNSRFWWDSFDFQLCILSTELLVEAFQTKSLICFVFGLSHWIINLRSMSCGLSKTCFLQQVTQIKLQMCLKILQWFYIKYRKTLLVAWHTWSTPGGKQTRFWWDMPHQLKYLMCYVHSSCDRSKQISIVQIWYICSGAFQNKIHNLKLSISSLSTCSTKHNLWWLISLSRDEILHKTNSFRLPVPALHCSVALVLFRQILIC